MEVRIHVELVRVVEGASVQDVDGAQDQITGTGRRAIGVVLDPGDVRVVEGVPEEREILAAIGRRSSQLQDVVEDAPRSVELRPTVAGHVPREAQTRGQLVAKSPLDGRVRDGGIDGEGGNGLILGPQAQVESQPVGDGPGVLNDEADVRVGRVGDRQETAIGVDGVAPHLVVAVLTPLPGKRLVPEEEGLIPRVSTECVEMRSICTPPLS